MTNLTSSQISAMNNMCRGAKLGVLGTTISEIQSNFTGVTKLYNLGAPVLADVDRIVISADMIVGAYALAAQPDVPRNITVTHTTVETGTDTLGTITIVGTDAFGETITEVITPTADSTVSGALAFATVVSATGAGWAITGGNDTITIGVGTVLGLPLIVESASQILLGTVGASVVVPTVVVDAAISECTVDLSSGTYDGTKKALVFVVQ